MEKPITAFAFSGFKFIMFWYLAQGLEKPQVLLKKPAGRLNTGFFTGFFSGKTGFF
jgi:hypothetical protein